MGELVVRNGLKLLGTLPSGTGDEILTVDPSSSEVGKISAIDTTVFVSKTLPSANIYVGNGSNVATATAMTGDVTIDNAGVTSISSGVIVNADINASAAIAVSKLAALTVSRALATDGSGVITPSAVTSTELGYLSGVTSAVQTQLNGKQATITGAATTITSSNLTASRALASDGSGKVAVSAVTATELGYVSGVTSAIQTQIDTKQAKIQFKDEGTNAGTSGGVTTVNFVGTGVTASETAGTLTVTINGIANGLPTGGTANQYLTKIDGTDYNTQWSTLEVADITDLTASAAELNLMDGVTATTAEINYIDGVTGNIQSQLDSKISLSLATGNILVGVASIATPLAPGSAGQVLTISGGVPAWVTPGTGGTVTSVAFSGGTTGLSVTGSPITTSGTITLAGTLVAANGGTGQSSYTVGDILYASTTTALSKLAAGTSGYVLTSNGAGVAPSWQAASGGGGGHDIYTGVGGSVLTTRANLRFQNGLTASDSAPDTLVKLGGVLIEATQIETTGFDLSIGAIGSGDGILTFTDNGTDADIGLYQSLFNFKLNSPTSGSTAIFTDSRGTTLGIQYAADYSGGFNSRSLIDKGYADGAYWKLASGGTLTAPNTITSNAANQLNFTGTWTATANSQFMAQFGGTLTSRNTASDNIYGYVINPTINRNAGAPASQRAAALYVNPTIDTNIPNRFGIASVTSSSSGYNGLRVMNTSTGSAFIDLVALSGGTLGTASQFYIERLNGANSNVNIANTGSGNLVLTANAASYTIKSGATSISQESYGLLLNTQGIISIADTSIQMYYSSATSGLINVASSSAGVYASTGALAASHKPVFLTIPGDYTAIAANTELIANEFRNPTSWTWADGTVTTQRFNYFKGFTVNKTTTSATFTNIYTMYVDASTAGTGVTLTNNHALGVNGAIGLLDGSGGNLAKIWQVVASTRHYLASGGSWYKMDASGFVLELTTANGNHYLYNRNQSSNWAPTLTVTPGAHTSMTANTEFIANDFQGANWTWADGTITTQRFNYFRSFSALKTTTSLTITNGYTLYADLVTPGTGVTITNNYAIGSAGNMRVFNSADLIIDVGTSNYVTIKGNLSNDVELIAGAGNGANPGKSLYLTSGSGGASGAQNAGNINIATGVPNGGGTEGSINIQTRSGAKIGFFGATAVVKQAGLTAITHTSPGTPDYAIQDLSAGGFGFVTKDEGNTVLSVIKAMHDAMKNYGLLT